MKTKLRIFIKRFGIPVMIAGFFLMLLGVFMGFAPVTLAHSAEGHSNISTYRILFGFHDYLDKEIITPHLILLIPFIASIGAVPLFVYAFILFVLERYEKACRFLLISAILLLIAGAFYMFSYLILQSDEELLWGYWFVGIPLMLSSIPLFICSMYPKVEKK